MTPRPGGGLSIDAGPLGPGAATVVRLEGDGVQQQEWTFEGDGPREIEGVSDGTIEVRPCTSDGRCALYEVGISAPPG